MIDVKEVLRRWSVGQSDRKIAREGVVDLETAARYTAVAASLFERGHELTDDELHEVAQWVQSRPVQPTSTEWNEVARHRPLIERCLAGDAETRPLRLTVNGRPFGSARGAHADSTAIALHLANVHTLLMRDHGLRASCDTLWRFAQDELAWREKPSTVRVEDAPPGQEAQVDFGKMGHIVDDETGKSACCGRSSSRSSTAAISSSGRRSGRRLKRSARGSTAHGCSSAGSSGR